jgi:hypothetical protein
MTKGGMATLFVAMLDRATGHGDKQRRHATLEFR